jgi:calcineurin-like phosphoesterase family protein
MPQIFFTADTHFGQQRTLELSKRPFESVDAMDAALIQNWNALITPEDTVYHLGDFGVRPDIIAELQGTISFLPGNYDTPEILAVLATRCQFIQPNTSVNFDGHYFQLIHEPCEASAPISPDHFFLYGHIHKLQMVKRNGLNVGVDCHHFKPLALADVIFYKQAVLHGYDENVFIERLGV